MCENSMCKKDNCEVEYGLCHCGCGEKTKLITKNNTNKSYFKGNYYLYLPNHHNRVSFIEYIINDETGCWEWQKGKSKGYGLKYIDGKYVSRAHRWYYEQKYGLVPEGLDLDHKCKNRGCVNPEHLEPVSRAENVRRGKSAKVTWEQVFEIRKLYTLGGITQAELSKKYSLSVSIIHYIVRYKTWILTEEDSCG